MATSNVKGTIGSLDAIATVDPAKTLLEVEVEVGGAKRSGKLDVQQLIEQAAITGPKGEDGPKGEQGDPGGKGDPGNDGADGKDNLELWLAKPENAGKTEDDFWEAQRGPKGDKGDTGDAGEDGVAGIGAIEYWLSLPQNAGKTEDDYFAEQKGADGADGQDGAPGEKGDKGDKGDPGADGKAGLPLNVIGALDDVANLPNSNDRDPGDAYVIQQHWWVLNDERQWTDLGSVVGPEGKSNYQIWLDLGNSGTEAEFLETQKGRDGIGLRILGAFNSVDDLPAVENAEDGDTYIIDKQMWVKAGDVWAPVGQVGPTGKSNYDLWLEAGNTGSITDFFEAQRGDKGDKGDRGDVGPMGPGIAILGKLATQDDLPASADNVGDGYLIDGDFWGWNGTAFENMGPIQGPKGDKGDKGEAGTDGAKGDKGEDGAKGADGAPSYIDGVYLDVADLPLTGQPGQCAWVGTVLHSWNGTAWIAGANLQGPKGDKGDQGDKGADGVDGQDGAKGETGAGVNLKGTLASEGDLPADPAVNDSYYIDEFVFTWIESEEWLKSPSIKGPKGDKGDKGDAGADGADGGKGDKGDKGDKGADGTNGTNGTDGQDGNDAFEVWKEATAQPDATKQDFVAAITGQGLTPKGEVATLTDLPATATNGDTYTVREDGSLRIWFDTGFVDMGVLLGPKGDKGDQGETGEAGKDADDNYAIWLTIPGNEGKTKVEFLEAQRGDQGIQGEQGEVGPMGPGVKIVGKVATTDDLPPTGENAGDVYIVGVAPNATSATWIDGAWVDTGPIQGPRGERGPKGDPGLRGDEGGRGETGAKGDQGSLWIVLPEPPTPLHGRIGDYYLNSATLEFFQKTSDVLWASLGHMGGGNVFKPDAVDTFQGMLNGEWAALEAALPASAKAGEMFVLTTTGLARFDGYDTAIVEVTGSTIDPTLANVFTLTLDANKTLDVPNYIADRSKVLVLRVTGSGGALTFTNVNWGTEGPPTAGDDFTVLTFFWDGSKWFGARGPEGSI